MDEIFIAAIDCSLANCGWNITKWNSKPEIQYTGIYNTEKIINKKYKSLQDIDRATFLIYNLQRSFFEKLYFFDSIPLIAYEIPQGSKSARAATTSGIVKGIIGYLYTLESMGFIFTGIQPKQAKKATLGVDTASKNEIIEYVCKKFNIKIKDKKYQILNNSYTKGQFEHIADSLIIGETLYKKVKDGKK